MTTPKELFVLDVWHANVKRVAIACHEAANFYTRCNVALGIPTILVTAAVGASAVSDILAEHKWALALLGVVATTLTTLQAFLGLSDRSAKHANAATEYGCLKRKIQQFMANDPATAEAQLFLTEVRESFDGLARTTPQIPTKVWNRALKRIPPDRDHRMLATEQRLENPSQRDPGPVEI